ncbi:MAG: tRNA threonylcarbamoyladenosine dehydratase [Bacillota bacterium]|nr:tRNA threonylcarbamoyladenosine dehydratase [Bacillota bacterium]
MCYQRFQRLVPLVGEGAFGKIQQSHVMIFGIGGVGSYAAEALARSGIGSLTLVDYDDVAIHNINRQIHALSSTVGRKKAEVMAERIKDIDPNINIRVIGTRVTPENIESFFPEPVDFILDAVDDVAAKISLICYGLDHSIPLISSMGTGNKLDPAALSIADISETSVCPLCRSVRRQLRIRGIEKGVTVVYSREQPITKGIIEDGRQVPASSCLVPPSAGILMASWVIRKIINEVENNKEELLCPIK